MKKLFLTLATAATILSGCCAHQDNSAEKSNRVIEAIMGRRSIRKYKTDPVEKEKLQKIAQCALNAPNAMNAQNWEVRIVDNREFLDGLDETLGRTMFYNAPAIVAIATPDDPSGMSLQNVGLMSENICLAAYSLGLGTCIMGGPLGALYSPAAEPFLDKLDFSEGFTVRIVIALGYPDESPAAKPRDASKLQFIE